MVKILQADPSLNINPFPQFGITWVHFADKETEAKEVYQPLVQGHKQQRQCQFYPNLALLISAQLMVRHSSGQKRTR